MRDASADSCARTWCPRSLPAAACCYGRLFILVVEEPAAGGAAGPLLDAALGGYVHCACERDLRALVVALVARAPARPEAWS